MEEEVCLRIEFAQERGWVVGKVEVRRDMFRESFSLGRGTQ